MKPRSKTGFLDVSVRTWQGRIVRKLLPREGWQQISQDLWVLSKTKQWLRPLYLQRTVTPQGVEYRAFEGEAMREKKDE
jgi:hypothetical protein